MTIPPADIEVVTSPQAAAALMDPEFERTLKEIEADKKKKLVEQSQPAPNPPQDRKPLSLTYKYEGNCPTCGRIPTTLMVDTDAGYFAVCYCTQDNVQLLSIKVDRLPEIETKKEEKPK